LRPKRIFMCRHVYSIIRFVPDPARGERVNIGMVAGSEITGEWGVRRVQDTSRAAGLATQEEADMVFAYLDRFIEELSSNYDYNEASHRQRVRDWQNALQLSAPLPVLAESVEEVFADLWPRLIHGAPQ